MKKLIATMMTAIALMGGLTVTAQTQDTEYQLFGHRVGTSYANGIYKFTSTKTTATKVADISATPDLGSVKVDDRYYVFSQDKTSGYGTDYYMTIYDVSDFKYVTRAKVTPLLIEGAPMAYNPVNKKVYTIYSENNYLYTLVIIDLSNRTKTEIGSLSTKRFWTLAFNEAGKLYGIADDGKLYAIDPTNANTTAIGSVGHIPNYQQAATFLPGDNNTMYWAGTFAKEDAALYKVDVTNGTTTPIEKFAEDAEFNTLWVGDKVVKAGAPAAATMLSTTFTNGSLKGTMNFTAPTTAHDGSSISGELTYKVFVDGTEKATGKTEAGKEVKAEIETTQGVHDFTVVMANTIGEGDKAELKSQYVGLDTPKPVKNIAFKRGTQPNEYVLTWENVTEGEHNGYIDPASVKYKVRKMPEDKVINERATSPYTFTIEQANAERCFFDVIPYVDNATTGLPMSSNKLLVGKAFEVPYSEDFSSNDNFLLYTIINVDDDNATWDYDYDYKFLKIYNTSVAKNDWAITPFIAVEKGMEYKLSFDVRSFGTETFEVKYGKDATVEAMTEQVLPTTEVASDGEFVSKECTFTAKETGNIFIGFHVNTTDVEKGMTLYLDNIKLDKTGATAINAVEATQAPQFIVVNSGLRMLGAAADVVVTRLDGAIIFHGTMQPNATIVLQKGVYIVRCNGKAQKIVVR